MRERERDLEREIFWQKVDEIKSGREQITDGGRREGEEGRGRERNRERWREGERVPSSTCALPDALE